MEKNILEEISAHFYEYDGMARALNVTALEISEIHSVVSMPLEEMHKNGLGTSHGGAVFALADIAFGVACAGAGFCCVTAQSSLSFIKPGKVSPLSAKCELINAGKKLMIYGIKVYDGSNTLLAQGQFTGYKLGTFEDFLNQAKEQKNK